MKKRLKTTAGALALAALTATPSLAQDREIKINGIGALSGVVRIFGINSKAAMEAAVDQINKSGGVKLGDGARGKLVFEYFDDRCTAEEGIAVA
ncbi:MAG: hypothetical protein RL291_1980, partial [Pseudomonadota bacterium]